MYAWESGYQKFIELHQMWMDKVAVANVEKATAIKQLQATAERKKMLQEEISHVTVELQSSRAALASAQ